MKMSATRVIARAADEIADFFFDASNNPKWQDGMVSCEWTSAAPIAVGSTYRQHARFMGRDVISTFEVTALEPGRSITIDTIESTFPIRVVRRVDPIDQGSCRVSAEISGGPQKGPLKWIEPLVGARAQKSVNADYDRLVQLLES